jgi:ParB family transcriptional regulator, chromosome partitioning protein
LIITKITEGFHFMEKRVLGKGLSALIPERDSVLDLSQSLRKESISFVKTQLIKDNSRQPRINYDADKINELMASIKEKGVLQPLLVRPRDGGYEVVAGERRLRAARGLDLEEVPVIIREVSDEEALVLALIENIQREELNAIEEGQAFQRLMEEFDFTQDQVAQSVGKDRSTISNTMRLLKLPSAIQSKVISGDLSMGHARVLVSVENPFLQEQLFQLVLDKSLSVRELENLSRSSAKPTRRRVVSKDNDHEILHLEEELQQLLGTRVRVQSQKKRGKIIIEYYSLNDLDRLLLFLRQSPHPAGNSL